MVANVVGIIAAVDSMLSIRTEWTITVSPVQGITAVEAADATVDGTSQAHDRREHSIIVTCNQIIAALFFL